VHVPEALTLRLTSEGCDVSVNTRAFRAVWKSGVLSLKKRVGRFKNSIHNGVYPATINSWLCVVTVVLGVEMAGFDPSLNMISFLQHNTGLQYLPPTIGMYVSTVLFCSLVWVVKSLVLKNTMKLLLSYTGHLYEPHGKPSTLTKIWFIMLKVLRSKNPLLYHYQTCLPRLPVPGLRDTVARYMKSVKHLKTEDEYLDLKNSAEEFCSGVGKRAQWYLVLKSWWSYNYVSDWWEEYVYLRSRSPLMVYSNYASFDYYFHPPTPHQVSRAATIVHCLIQARRSIDRQEVTPTLINGVVPICMSQVERLFNTTRIPGTEADKIIHLTDTDHIAVYHKGRYYKLYIRHRGRLLSPPELEISLQKILDDDSAPAEGEKHLASLTAGERTKWAEARDKFFSRGRNKASLDAIEKSAFVLVLEAEDHGFYENDPDKTDQYGRCMLHGSGGDRWFDKSFTFIVTTNGHFGANAEHGWADASILALLWEMLCDREQAIGYTSEGRCKGTAQLRPPNPVRLEWDIQPSCQQLIESSFHAARALIDDLSYNIIKFEDFGKNFMKQSNISPDGFIQASLQLTYYKLSHKVCLTYESGMARSYRDGRTETVRSCSGDLAQFVKAMAAGRPKSECLSLLRKSASTHVNLCKAAISGEGVDRHLFCLYLVSKYLGVESPFLQKALMDDWKLSTSQVPHGPTDNPKIICIGGAFGPVADEGYGVAYMIPKQEMLFFHVTTKNSCPTTDAHKFTSTLRKSLCEMRDLFL